MPGNGLAENTCGGFTNKVVKLTGVLAGLGFNSMTEKLGLDPLPLSNGDSFDFNPGFILKQEIHNICRTGPSQSILKLDLSSLSNAGQGLLLDRLGEMGNKALDRPLNIPGKRYELPLSFFNLPQASIVLWAGPKFQFTNPKIENVNAVMVNWKFANF